MQETVLIFSFLLGFLHETINDTCGASDATKYKVSEGILAAFSMAR